MGSEMCIRDRGIDMGAVGHGHPVETVGSLDVIPREDYSACGEKWFVVTVAAAPDCRHGGQNDDADAHKVLHKGSVLGLYENKFTDFFIFSKSECSRWQDGCYAVPAKQKRERSIGMLPLCDVGNRLFVEYRAYLLVVVHALDDVGEDVGNGQYGELVQILFGIEGNRIRYDHLLQLAIVYALVSRS